MATLNINDLSVGDWVRWNVYDKTYDMQVSGVTDRRIYGLREGIEYSMLLTQICSIPITAEILEKNGFVDIGSHLFRYEREWRGDKSAVNICSFDEELWFADFEFRDGRTCMSNIPIFYVNQLQHVLRLVGVDKEINL